MQKIMSAAVCRLATILFPVLVQVFLFAGALLLTGLLTNCRKTEILPPCVDLLPDPPTDTIDPANPTNPFDFVGLQHNAALEYIFTGHAEKVAAVGPAPQALQDLYIQLARNFALEQGYADAENFPLELYLNAITQGPEALIADEHFADFKPYLASVDVPPHVRPWLEKLYSVLVPYASQGPEALPALLTSIRDFENELTVSLDPEAASIPLIAAATARHSAAYWAKNKDYTGPMLFGWGEAWFADALGAGMGAAAGAAVGAAAGGAPSVPGAVVGGVIGGVIASAAFAG